ncbi:MAG: UDP-N-acetylmuramoyl-tripeptide--D-alanyl-D-alanine ligase, partial [Victivallales bacterium]|nr:UDP-N-acetylmuramoyl-tripeptide--D-alanyl-D-alanine ligase [Victivallales bacterium]
MSNIEQGILNTEGRYTFAELAEWTSNDWKFPFGKVPIIGKVDSSGTRSAEKQPSCPILGISHDTRTLKEGDVYIAIKGERFDGHDFVEQAIGKGAAGLIVERDFPAFAEAMAGKPSIEIPQLIVPDTMAALWQLAAGARSTWTGIVIGITGSVGKTTVKELIASILAQKGTVAKTLGNWNNDIGLPLSMLAADRAADFFVFELGMNHPGEIDPLAGLLKPDWALITNIGKAHTEFFHSASLERLTVETPKPTPACGHPSEGGESGVAAHLHKGGDIFKSPLREGCRNGGVGLPTYRGTKHQSFNTLDGSGMTGALERIAEEKAAILNHASNAILNSDSEWFDRLRAGFQGRVVTLTHEPFSALQPGAHMVQNTRFAATVGLELGLSHEEIQRGLNSFQPLPMRWQTIKNDGVVFNGVVFINDAYNANPLSMRAALSTFADLPCEGRRFVVLGGMRELGAASEAEHAELLRFAESLTFDRLILVGSLWPTGIKKNAVGDLLRENLRAGDKVLFKGSRGERLETILEELNVEQAPCLFSRRR